MYLYQQRITDVILVNKQLTVQLTHIHINNLLAIKKKKGRERTLGNIKGTGGQENLKKWST